MMKYLWIAVLCLLCIGCSKSQFAQFDPVTAKPLTTITVERLGDTESKMWYLEQITGPAEIVPVGDANDLFSYVLTTEIWTDENGAERMSTGSYIRLTLDSYFSAGASPVLEKGIEEAGAALSVNPID